MPYLVVTNPAGDITRMTRAAAERLRGAERRRAAISLERVREECIAACPDEMRPRVARGLAMQIANLTESGGIVVLPDGKAIKVEHVGWRHIEDALGYHLGYPGSRQEAIDAYNARRDRLP